MKYLIAFVTGISLLGSALLAPAQNIRREYWLNIPGNSVSALTSSPDYPNNPSGVDFPTLFEGPISWNENYGSRLRGYVHPPVTGDYIFYISSDDNGALYLSSDEYPATRQLIATEPSWNGSRNWFGTDRRPNGENISAPIRLEAGRRYYIEALQKEGGGGDNVAVAWRLPDGTLEGPIPASRISPFLISTNPPNIVEQPASLSVSEGTRAEFRVVATGAEPLNFQWQVGGLDLPGQSFPNLIIDPASLAEDGNQYRCLVTNPLGSVTSVVVSLTVTPEVVPPAILTLAPAAGSTVRQLSQIEVFFTEAVAGVDAADLLVNGTPATGVVGSGGGPYVFSFPAATPGTISLSWAAGHGITDLSLAVNPFAGSPWQLTVNPAASFPDVVINEILASNLSGLADEDGEIGDWVELHNRGAAPASLAGWSLSDDASLPGLWVFPSVSIPANGYLVVFVSGKDRRVAGANLHASFKLSRVGEFVGLYNGEYPRAQIDALAPAFPEQRGDHSYGRDSAGVWKYYATPTPGVVNGDSAITGLSDPPHFSARRGFYDQPFNLHLSAVPGAQIRFTTDGSEPTAATGTVYSGPIPISTTTTLRAAAFVANQVPSVTVTHTYLMGLPPNLQSLPVMSLVTRNGNLWGPTGIMEINPRNTVNRGIAWERPVSAELIRPADNGGFALDAGLRVQGGGYVRQRYDPNAGLPFSKYSFRLYFRGDYGATRLDYPMFPDVPFDEFEKISLRAGMNDHSNPFIIDELVRRLYGDTGNVSSHGTVVNLFLNGVYKGYYNPTERIDADFLQSWYGGTNDWDLVAQFGEVREGDAIKWNEMKSYISGNDMSSPSAYANAAALMDIDNFIDYLLVNVYAGTGDWPHNNWRAARPRVPGGKFRFMVWDAEWAFGHAGRVVTVNNLTGELSGSSDIARMFQSLLGSPEFRMRFADRVHRHMFNGGALMDANVSARYWQLRNEMAGVLPNMNSYIHNTFIPGRRNIIFGQLAAMQLYASDHAPVFNQHGGRIPDGFNLSMSAPRGTIHYTLDGTDPRLPAGANSQEFQLLTRTAAKRVLVPGTANGGNLLGDGWKGGAEPYNDSTWISGTGGVGYDTDVTYDPHIQIDTETAMLGVNGSAYLRVAFDTAGVNLADLNQLSLLVQYDDGFVAYLNGVEVQAANAPASRAWNSLATAGNADSAAVNFQAFNVSPHLGLLKPGANVLAIHGLNVSTNSSDFLCNVELIGRKVVPGAVSPLAGTYTAPIPLNQPVTVKARSLDNDQWSALTEATFEPNILGLPLRFTELMYNPVGGDAYEFIELHNYGFAPVNLSSFSFEGINYLFPAGSSIAGGETIVLASDVNPALFASRYPGLAVAGHFGGSLSNGGERVALLDAIGNVVVAVTFDDGGTWDSSADGGGASLVLADPLTDPDQSSAWRGSAGSGGDPGLPTPQAVAPQLRINELMADNTNAVPHEGSYPDWLELHNAGPAAVNLAGWSLTDDGDPRKFVFPAGTVIGAGGYLVVWCDSAATSGLHAGFSLDRDGETVVLYDPSTNRVDALSYGLQLTDYSLGRIAGFANPWRLNSPTPGGANLAALLAPASSLVINEWLADAVPGQADWFELYNSHATAPVSLQGLHAGNGSSLHVLRGHSFLAPGGFLRLFADEQAGIDHVEFKLPAGGGSLSIYDSTGALIQRINYGTQTEGVSQGRLPNGSATIQSFAGSASPGASNYALSWFGPVLNEFMALNNGAVVMASGRAADWIELRNPGVNPFDLTGMSLSFGDEEPGEWQFPAGLVMPAGGHLVIWCDEDLPVTTNAVPELNAGRSLSGRGDAVHLFNSAGQRVDSAVFGPQIADVTVGRQGSLWRLKLSPTPGAANSGDAATGLMSDLRINEWQANPLDGDDWIELYNAGSSPLVLDGSFITDDPSSVGRTKHRFGTASYIAARGWLRLIADGNPGKGGDHLGFSLAAGGDHLRLHWVNLSTIDSQDFGSQAPGTSTGRFPDGTDNLVTFTTTVSPGDSNYLPLGNVVVNEVLAHTDPPFEDAVELHNPTGLAVDVGGWFLSDDSANLKKFQLPGGTIIPAGGFRVLYEGNFNGGAGTLVPFTLNSARGDSVYFSQADSLGNLTGYRAQVAFGPTFNGVSLGRIVTSSGIDFGPLLQPTFGVSNPASVAQFRTGSGAANAQPRIPNVVISEIMAGPPALPDLDADDGEFVELINRSAAAVALHDPLRPSNTWKLSGAVDFSFPAGASIAPNGRVLVVGFDPVARPDKLQAFIRQYDVPSGVAVLGPFSGRLAAAGEKLQLLQPDAPQTSGPDIGLVPHPEVEQVTWSNLAPWPTAGIGLGASLQRLAVSSYANDPVNWLAAVPTAGGFNRGSPLDSDNDGMPDWWEDTHGLNRLSSADATLDPDGDGVSSRDEFRAGTNPRSLVSLLAIEDVSHGGGVTTIGFRAQAGVSYDVQYRDVVGTGSWQSLGTVPAGWVSRDTVAYDVESTVPQRFYRVVVP